MPRNARKSRFSMENFYFFGSSNGNRWSRRMPSRVAEVMQFHGQNPPYISMCFRSLFLLQSRTKLALFLALSFTSHKSEISFNIFYVFPISATPPTNSSRKKRKLPCAKEHYHLGCPSGPSSTARSLEA